MDAGFTLAEVLAALIFLAILVPTVIEGLTLANRVSVMTERSAGAGELAENKMNELLLDGTSSDASESSAGDFGTDWPGYRWESTEEAWDEDNTMTQLSVEVFYPVQGAEHSVTLSTLISSGTDQSVSGL
jgi:type II secretory pathway pseudopilin PulG